MMTPATARRPGALSFGAIVRLSRAVVRRPSQNFAEGLTRSDLGAPTLAAAKAQHGRYCEELLRSGLQVTYLSADGHYPDGTFVEDTAIITGRGAIFMRPGAASRQGEVPSVREVLSDLVPALGEIEAPGTVDGGDVCAIDNRFLIGISSRTNEEGARQLAAILSSHGYDATLVDLRGLPDLLHLKSGLAALDDGRLVAVAALASRDELRGYATVRVDDRESYAANCVCVNGRVLIARGFPLLESELVKLRYDVVTLEMSEFRKMDGGLSCLSLRL
jgi:dimethylargininase